MAKSKVPDNRQSATGASKPSAAMDPRQVVAVALDAEIAQLRAQLAKLEKQGGDEAAIEQVRKVLHLRAIQRVKL